MTRTRWIPEDRLTIAGDKGRVRGEGQEYQAARSDGGVPAKILDASRHNMNKLEQRYCQYLEALKFGREIRDFRFEPFRLILADRCTYRPDFFVLNKDGIGEIHETKGFFREDALVKIKVAAREFYWWEFKVIRWVKGQWEVKHV